MYLYTGELAILKLFRSESNHKGLKLAEFEGFTRRIKLDSDIRIKDANLTSLSPLWFYSIRKSFRVASSPVYLKERMNLWNFPNYPKIAKIDLLIAQIKPTSIAIEKLTSSVKLTCIINIPILAFICIYLYKIYFFK